jgi:hypothetical protein
MRRNSRGDPVEGTPTAIWTGYQKPQELVMYE